MFVSKKKYEKLQEENKILRKKLNEISEKVIKTCIECSSCKSYNIDIFDNKVFCQECGFLDYLDHRR